MKTKNFNIKDSYTQIAVVMMFILLIALIPLVILGFYAHPCADDFSYGHYTHYLWSTSHSLSQTIQGALDQVRAQWFAWQGTFSSIFLMVLSPAVWGEEFYFLTPIIMLLMIIVPHFYFLKKVIVDLLDGSKNVWLIISSTTCFLMIETMLSPVEGLFWFNGAVHYVFMHGCMIALFGVLISLMNTNKLFNKVLFCLLASILALACGGGNYATALFGILGTAFFLVLAIWKKKRFCTIVPLAIYGISFYMSATAYGNTKRQVQFVKSDPITAILDSFSEMFTRSGEWMSLQIVFFMLLLVPIFWKIANTQKLRFKLPVIVTLLSFCTNACMLTPGLYAMGISGAGRTLNIVKMWFITLLFLNEGYWIGYIRKKIEAKLPERKLDVRLWMAGALLLIIALFVIDKENRVYDYSSYTAYSHLESGEARLYNIEYKGRLKLLTGEKEEVKLLPFTTRPYLLYYDDITTDSNDWRNTAVASWYGKERVYLLY